MEAYPRAAMERAMKVQNVMLQAMAKKITWWQAAEILGISDRHMRQWRERYAEEGYNRLFDRRRGKPSRRRVAFRHRVKAVQVDRPLRSLAEILDLDIASEISHALFLFPILRCEQPELLAAVETSNGFEFHLRRAGIDVRTALSEIENARSHDHNYRTTFSAHQTLRMPMHFINWASFYKIREGTKRRLPQEKAATLGVPDHFANGELTKLRTMGSTPKSTRQDGSADLRLLR